MYYCTKCRKIFKEVEAEICECGQILNLGSDNELEFYLRKGYILALSQEQQKSKADGNRNLEFVRNDILQSMGVESYAELFNPEYMIAQYIQGVSNRENEKKEKEMEIWSERKKNRKRKQEQRTEFLNKKDSSQTIEDVENIFDVANFLASLNLQKG